MCDGSRKDKNLLRVQALPSIPMRGAGCRFAHLINASKPHKPSKYDVHAAKAGAQGSWYLVDNRATPKLKPRYPHGAASTTENQRALQMRHQNMEISGWD